jgi:hypothetical protein
LSEIASQTQKEKAMTMERGLTRRRFMSSLPIAGAASLVVGPTWAGNRTPADVHSDFPRLESAAVEQVVRFAHFEMDEVRRLVEGRPELAKASWDWGFGDWESALGAASHTGHREFATFLMNHGARPNLFTAAMMGWLDVVRAMVAVSPGVERIPGPHGLSLLHHARAGGEPAVPVVAFLEELGGADASAPALDEATVERYLGRFVVPENGLEITTKRGRRGDLQLVVGSATPRTLVKTGDHRFHPAGAPSVVVLFEMAGAHAIALSVSESGRRLQAVRRPIDGSS